MLRQASAVSSQVFRANLNYSKLFFLSQAHTSDSSSLEKTRLSKDGGVKQQPLSTSNSDKSEQPSKDDLGNGQTTPLNNDNNRSDSDALSDALRRENELRQQNPLPSEVSDKTQRDLEDALDEADRIFKNDSVY